MRDRDPARAWGGRRPHRSPGRPLPGPRRAALPAVVGGPPAVRPCGAPRRLAGLRRDVFRLGGVRRAVPRVPRTVEDDLGRASADRNRRPPLWTAPALVRDRCPRPPP